MRFVVGILSALVYLGTLAVPAVAQQAPFSQDTPVDIQTDSPIVVIESAPAAPPPVSQPAVVPASPPREVPTASDAPAAAPAMMPLTASPPSSGLSNNNTYTNVDGNTVHSPAYSTTGGVPAGASAQCSDGTYSFSQHAQGTCSGHGGVAQGLTSVSTPPAPSVPASTAPSSGCGSRGGPGGPRTASGRCPSR